MFDSRSRSRFAAPCLFRAAIVIASFASVPSAHAQPRNTAIVFLGSFYSEVEGEEYLYRDQVDLWREGPRVFGLTASSMGSSPTYGRFEGTIDDRSDSLHLSGSGWNDFRATLRGSVLTGAAWSDPLIHYGQARDPMGSHPEQAPTVDYEAWRVWADSLIDDAESKDPGVQQDIEKCHAGDSWACLNIGNRLKYRKLDEARHYWKIACEGGNWAGCKFLGEHDRYLAILQSLCSTSEKPSLARNMACEELGRRSENAGQMDDAVRWYELGCNGYKLPTTCCDRLKALHRAGQEQRQPR